jgi:hypothetical protein
VKEEVKVKEEGREEDEEEEGTSRLKEEGLRKKDEG